MAVSYKLRLAMMKGAMKVFSLASKDENIVSEEALSIRTA